MQVFNSQHSSGENTTVVVLGQAAEGPYGFFLPPGTKTRRDRIDWSINGSVVTVHDPADGPTSQAIIEALNVHGHDSRFWRN